MRFTHEQHITQNRTFEEVRNEGRMYDCGAFIVRIRLRSILATDTAPKPRLGVIASRRVGNAVARNRVKRLFRELFRLNQLILPPNADVLLIARQYALKWDFVALQNEYLKAVPICLRKCASENRIQKVGSSQ